MIAATIKSFGDYSFGPAGYSLLMKYELAAGMLGWTTLYLVKASFLALCRSVFNVSRGFRMAWWIVTAYTFITYWPIVLSTLWQCGDPLQYADYQTCNEWTVTNGNRFSAVTAEIALALHISSDCLILGLPLPMIRRLQMSRVQRMSIAAVFALVAVDIIMGIMRNATYICSVLGTDYNYCTYVTVVMSICEPSIAVIVCALPAYRVLLPKISSGSYRIRKMRQSPENLINNAPQPSTLGLGEEASLAETSEIEMRAVTEAEL